MAERFLPDVTCIRYTVTSKLFNQFFCLLSIVVLIKVHDHHISTFFSEEDSDCPANATITPSNQSDASLKLVCTPVPRFILNRLWCCLGFDTRLLRPILGWLLLSVGLIHGLAPVENLTPGNV
jgi:hypothetical protein